jgi:hypothetical protein
MTEISTCDRRRFLGAAVGTVTVAGRLMAESLDADSDAGAQAAPDPPRTGGATSFRRVKQIDAVDVAPLLAAEGCRVIVPYLRGYGTTGSARATHLGTPSRRHWARTSSR